MGNIKLMKRLSGAIIASQILEQRVVLPTLTENFEGALSSIIFTVYRIEKQIDLSAVAC